MSAEVGRERDVVQSIVDNYSRCLKRESETLETLSVWSTLLGLDPDTASAADLDSAIRRVVAERADAHAELAKLRPAPNAPTAAAPAAPVSAAEGEEAFTAWFVANYPHDCIISEPRWHAPTIYRNAIASHATAALHPEGAGR